MENSGRAMLLSFSGLNLGAAVFIALNWLTYIWAVNTSHVVEASLGYFINPLVSILFGMLIFGERMSRAGAIGCLLALAGDDTVTGGAGADSIHGNQGDDQLKYALHPNSVAEPRLSSVIPLPLIAHPATPCPAVSAIAVRVMPDTAGAITLRAQGLLTLITM